MAAPVGSLVVRIGSDITGLVRGLGVSSRTLKQFGEDARKLARRITLISTASAAAGAALVGKLTRDGLKSIDTMAKFSRVIGVSTESLAGLQNAAEQTAGFTGQQFNLAFQRMTRRIAEAAQGTGEAQGAIKALGLDAAELARAGPDEAFLKIADAMQNVDDQGERLRLGFKLFDSEGARLVNTLSAGRDEIERLGREAATLGLAFSAVDAAQVEAANDSLRRIGAVIEGISRRLAVELSPFIQEFADRFRDAAKESGGFGEQIERGIQGAIRAAGALANAVRFIEIGAKATALAFFEIRDASREFLFGEKAARRFAEAAVEASNSLPGGKRLQELSDGMGGARAETQAFAEELAKLVDMPLPSEGIEEFFDKVRERAAAARAEAAAVTSGADVGDPLGRLSADGGDQITEAEREQLERRLEMIRQGLLTERELEVEAFEDKMERLRQGLEQELLTREEFLSQKEQLEAQHQQSLADIEKKGAEQRERTERAIQAARIRSITTQFDAIASLTGTLNRTLFDNSKAGALAEAIILGVSGALRTWNAYPYPWNIIPTAAHIAGTAAQVAQISSASFSGGRTASAPSAIGAGGAAPSGPGAGGGGGGDGGGTAAGNQAVNINLVGRMFNRDQVRELIGEINDAVADGATLRVV